MLIYIIYNNFDNQVYIGKTSRSIEERWKEHLRDYKKFPSRKLYNAFLNNGIENFFIEELKINATETDESSLIKEFDSYYNGYNSTLGGEGSPLYDIDVKEAYSLYNKTEKLSLVAEYFGVDRTTLSNLFKRHNKPIVLRRSYQKKQVISKKLGKTFNSLTECCEYLVANGVSTVNLKSTISSVTKVCNGHRKSYKGYDFKYL